MTFVARGFSPRRAQTQASYYPNHLIIELGSDTRLLDDDGNRVKDLSPNHAATFVHEYMHYLHNVSTLAGFKSFHLWQQLLALFSETLASDGSSRGSDSMGPEQRSKIAALLKTAELLEGDAEPKLSRSVDEVAQIDVTGLSEIIKCVPLGDGTTKIRIVVLECDATFEDGTVEACKFNVGTLAIEEGIAYEVDRMVAASGNNSSAADDAPPFPYLVLRELGLHLVPTQIERIALVACAVLSLQTAAPTKSLVDSIRRYSSLRQGGSTIVAALGQLVTDTAAHREGAIDVARQDLQGLIDVHRGRGVSENAIRQAADIYERLLQRRLRDPFWELAPFTRNVIDPGALTQLLSDVLPCDVIQQRDGDDDDCERDMLLTFGGDQAAEASKIEQDIQALRVLQCMLHYVQAHSGARKFVASSELDDATCPFYTSCSLKLRGDHADTCRREPWKIFEKSRAETCWYGTATASTLGGVIIHEVRNHVPKKAVEKPR